MYSKGPISRPRVKAVRPSGLLYNGCDDLSILELSLSENGPWGRHMASKLLFKINTGIRMPPHRHQGITWTNADTFLNGPGATNSAKS